jgi:hypothetical protein
VVTEWSQIPSSDDERRGTKGCGLVVAWDDVAVDAQHDRDVGMPDASRETAVNVMRGLLRIAARVASL